MANSTKINRYPGFFITFEGIEGAGKTTQLNLLKETVQISEKHLLKEINEESLLDESIYENVFTTENSVFTKEPGSTAIGKKIRTILLNNKIEFITELLLIYANRYEHLVRVILPALEEGKIVFCDRYIDSTIVYQGKRGYLGRSLIDICNNLIGNYVHPDLTFLLDTSVDIANIRKTNRSSPNNRFDLENQEIIRAEYLELAKEEPNRFIIISDTGQDPDTINRHITLSINSYINEKYPAFHYI